MRLVHSYTSPLSIIGVTGDCVVPILKPFSFRPSWIELTISQSLFLNPGFDLINSSLFKFPITRGIGKDFAKICDLNLYLKLSIISASPETKAPILAIDLANVEKNKSIPSCTPCSSPLPAPVSPIVPKPWASSTKSLKL